MATLELPPWYATEIGQILMSLDGTTFEPVAPLVDEDGDLITSESGVLVVEG